MSDVTDLPFIDFDPRTQGPREALRAKYHRLKTWVEEHQIISSVGAVLLVVSLGWISYQGMIPTIPNSVRVALVVSALGSGTYIWIGMRTSDALYTPDAEILHVLDAEDGDVEIVRLAPHRFEELTVINQNGRKKSKSELHQVRINGVRAYEVDGYREDLNIAVTSWQADATNRDMRLHRQKVDDVKKDLEEEVDKTFEMLIQGSTTVRRHSSEIANEIIHVAEEVETPTDSSLTERLTDQLAEAKPGESLLDLDADREEPRDPRVRESRGVPEEYRDVSETNNAVEIEVDDD